MGLELIAGISAIVGVIGGVGQAIATSQAASAQKEANAIQGAQQETASMNSRRQKIRENRIRRAQLLAGSENQGTGGSSGEIGAIGALNTNLAGMFGESLGESKANSGINSNLQRAADWTSTANLIGGITGTIQSGFGGFQSVFDQ